MYSKWVRKNCCASCSAVNASRRSKTTKPTPVYRSVPRTTTPVATTAATTSLLPTTSPVTEKFSSEGKTNPPSMREISTAPSKNYTELSATKSITLRKTTTTDYITATTTAPTTTTPPTTTTTQPTTVTTATIPKPTTKSKSSNISTTDGAVRTLGFTTNPINETEPIYNTSTPSLLSTKTPLNITHSNTTPRQNDSTELVQKTELSTSPWVASGTVSSRNATYNESGTDEAVSTTSSVTHVANSTVNATSNFGTTTTPIGASTPASCVDQT